MPRCVKVRSNKMMTWSICGLCAPLSFSRSVTRAVNIDLYNVCVCELCVLGYVTPWRRHRPLLRKWWRHRYWTRGRRRSRFFVAGQRPPAVSTTCQSQCPACWPPIANRLPARRTGRPLLPPVTLSWRHTESAERVTWFIPVRRDWCRRGRSPLRRWWALTGSLSLAAAAATARTWSAAYKRCRRMLAASTLSRGQPTTTCLRLPAPSRRLSTPYLHSQVNYAWVPIRPNSRFFARTVSFVMHISALRYIPERARVWNVIPPDVIMSSSPSVFKRPMTKPDRVTLLLLLLLRSYNSIQ